MDFDKEMSGFNAHYANELKKKKSRVRIHVF